jgi:hypothetical protein
MTDQNDKFPFNKHSETPNSKPQQHRCNAHLEDVLEGLSQWPLDVSKPFSVFLSCLKSQPGNIHYRSEQMDKMINCIFRPGTRSL